MDPRVHIPLLNMDPGSIFRGGGIFNMTPALAAAQIKPAAV